MKRFNLAFRMFTELRCTMALNRISFLDSKDAIEKRHNSTQRHEEIVTKNGAGFDRKEYPNTCLILISNNVILIRARE
jgi:hypothetical protein